MRSYFFGPFVLRPEQQMLRRGDVAVRIGSRALELLAALVERPGEVMSKSELRSRVWPDTFVEESNLKVNIAALRRALGDGRDGERYIATIAGRGYRFVAQVRTGEGRDNVYFAPPPALRSHNLPAPSGRVVGRTQAIEAVLQALETSRLVTVVGAGGIGKTTVALAAADRLKDSYRHGVWFVDLAPVSDASLVPASIAAAVGLTTHSSDVGAALAAFTRDREILLILDNCEHLIQAAARCVDALLSGAAGARVLATSREPLGNRGERLYRLPSLETPTPPAGLSAAKALVFPAVELFVERAGEVLGAFTLSDENAPAVAEICRRLDGLALAIELAATRLDAFDTRELLDLLDDRFRLLQGRQTDRTRHQTLNATLDWSYGLLSEDERCVLRRLAVFAGAVSLESACAIAAGEGRGRGETIVDIANLVAKSLLSTEIGPSGTHYRLLDTTRRYAREKLAESGELDQMLERHAEHLLQLAERAAAEWTRRPPGEWLDTYGRRIDDIRSALAWAFSDNRRPRLGVALTVAALPFWEHLSLVAEWRASAERALRDAYSAFRDERADMKLNMALGTALLHTRGPLPEVETAWARALKLAETLHDTEYELRCLWGLCDFQTWTGEHRSALATADRIRKLAASRGESSASNNVDRQAGTALRYLGELSESRRRLERMIARYVPPATRSDIARFQLDPRLAACGTLANVLWLQGYPDRAMLMAEQQLQGARDAGHAVALCNALVHTACPIALLRGDLAAAERLLCTIEAHVAEHGMSVWSAMGGCLRGEWLLRRGEAVGLAVLRGALDELSGVGFRMRRPFHLGVYAAGLGAHGDVADGLAVVGEAIALSEAGGEVWAVPELLRVKGDLMSLRGDDGDAHVAAELYRKALERARAQGALSWELRAAASLAELRHRSDGDKPAADLLAAVFGRFEEGFQTSDLVRARALLDVLDERGDGRRAFACRVSLGKPGA